MNVLSTLRTKLASAREAVREANLKIEADSGTIARQYERLQWTAHLLGMKYIPCNSRCETVVHPHLKNREQLHRYVLKQNRLILFLKRSAQS